MATNPDRRVPRELATRCHTALQKLLEAYMNAQQLREHIWNFAVDIKYLREAGLADHDLRWLVLQGYAEHAAETTASHRRRRTFRRTGLVRLTTKTCVVLTERGAVWVRQLGKGQGRRQRKGPKTPTYDSDARELRVGSLVVKRFRQPATGQEAIALAFQRRGWPPTIDNPLPGLSGISRKKQLRDAIHNLNRHQRQPLIHFYGDGTGQRVGWEWRR